MKKITKISSQVVAHSVDVSTGKEIVTLLLTYPRIIHSELMTHRVFSRNSASSRAIPFKKMVESVRKDPFIPIAFQKDHKGMQGKEYITGFKLILVSMLWVSISKIVCLLAILLHKFKVTKQLCNRILEPFMWYKVLVTSTEWSNFFELRCPVYRVNSIIHKSYIELNSKEEVKGALFLGFINDFYIPKNDTYIEWLRLSSSDAEIHIQVLAESIYNSINNSTPLKLNKGDWHIPFRNQILIDNSNKEIKSLIKISTGMCARTSYTISDDLMNINSATYNKFINIHDKMINSKPFHASPFEHCALNMSDKSKYRNFSCFKQYRQILEEQQNSYLA